MSDSGGIQEEATAPSIRKKVVVVRKTSDRPESIHANMAELVKLDSKSISKKINQTFLNPKFPRKTSPYGNGTTSQKIIKILQKENNFIKYYDFGTGRLISIKEVVKKIAHLLNKPTSLLRFNPQNDRGDGFLRSKAKKFCAGWIPKYSIDKGLRHFINRNMREI